MRCRDALEGGGYGSGVAGGLVEWPGGGGLDPMVVSVLISWWCLLIVLNFCCVFCCNVLLGMWDLYNKISCWACGVAGWWRFRSRGGVCFNLLVVSFNRS
ncbi:hypothetical protein RchiOBHm_Chr7g0200791 [Rosa chinensis]|uniref:Transmembrane protein n=1 Tax=Rosa chinensis TaxID=74649 RepID=A0A2P6P7R7_ROSCH|nr:hypothetical protein RchiOBHm_Chr7g0200791 [Rosa chinensis]